LHNLWYGLPSQEHEHYMQRKGMNNTCKRLLEGKILRLKKRLVNLLPYEHGGNWVRDEKWNWWLKFLRALKKLNFFFLCFQVHVKNNGLFGELWKLCAGSLVAVLMLVKEFSTFIDYILIWYNQWNFFTSIRTSTKGPAHNFHTIS
jgi:hypothetical protein